ncbi:hypothetical protein NL533_35565, partial [Klebsiella pneumoniae]|nr:hypothetical protein [Klebsiella pneumoniae]
MRTTIGSELGKRRAEAQMKLLSVNVGKVQPIQTAKPSGKTGIFKQPRTEPVMITALGLEGDAIVDTQNHG